MYELNKIGRSKAYSIITMEKCIRQPYDELTFFGADGMETLLRFFVVVKKVVRSFSSLFIIKYVGFGFLIS